MKPGYKTTEFWLSLLVMILGTLMGSGIITDGSTVEKIIGGALAILGAMGYTYNRMGVKKADTLAAAYVNKPAVNDNATVDPTRESA